MLMIPTRWSVITGAPCSGKTTTVNELQQHHGFLMNPEASRRHFSAQMALGRTVAEITSNWTIFLNQVFGIQSVAENELDPERMIVLDRSIVDSLAYRRFRGVTTEMFPAVAQVRRYKHVFVLERLTFTADGVRVENDELATRIQAGLIQAYTDVGYQPVIVPVMPLEDRVTWILERMK